MIKHSFNKQLEIMELVALDVVTVDQIIEYYINISKDNSLPRDLKTRIDCTKANLQIDFKKNEIEKARFALQKAINVFDSIHEAAIVIEPYETAVTMLFREFNHDIKNYCFEVFCTQKASLKWLLSN
jgi:hypothetical protein